MPKYHFKNKHYIFEYKLVNHKLFFSQISIFFCFLFDVGGVIIKYVCIVALKMKRFSLNYVLPANSGWCKPSNPRQYRKLRKERENKTQKYPWHLFIFVEKYLIYIHY